MDLSLDGWMVAWDEDGAVEVGPWPDRVGWSDRYAYTSGCCYLDRRSFSESLRVAMLFIDFHTLVVVYGVKPDAVHQEFLKIKEYRRRIASDCAGAEIQ